MEYWSPSSLVGLSIVFVFFTTTLVVLRIISRRAQKIMLGPDDWLMLVAWVLTLVMCIVTIEAVADGLWGVPLDMVDPNLDPTDQKAMLTSKFTDAQSRSGHYDFANTIIFTLQVSVSKLSILFFLRRIFVVAKQGFMHWATLVMIVLVSVWGIVLFFQGLFQCPHDASINWTGPLLAMVRQCQNMKIGIVLHGLDPLWDLLIMLLPIRSIWLLNTSRAKKLAVAAVFAVGSLSIAASFVRLASNIQTLTGSGGDDVNYNVSLAQSEFWQLFEAGFAVMTACLPSIQYLIKSRFGKPSTKYAQYYPSYNRKGSANSSSTTSSGAFGSREFEKPTGRYALEA